MLILALAAGVSINPSDQLFSQMAQLYNEICLKTFPDDRAVKEIMASWNARELSQDEVKVTMGHDPAAGWQLQGSNATVWLEFPPYHACSVRWNSPERGSLDSYRSIATKYQTNLGGFQAIQPIEHDLGEIHVHGVGERRILPDGGVESMYVIEQSINNPARRANGETGFSVRFVHQLAPAPH